MKDIIASTCVGVGQIAIGHPFDTTLVLIQNKKNILFCGSYFGYGFHEDGIKSTLEMIKFLND